MKERRRAVAFGTLVDGRIVLDDRQAWTLAVGKLPTGPMRLTLETTSGHRTANQNAYLYAVPFPILADHLGYTIEEVKLVLLAECFGWHELMGHHIPVEPSTSALTVEQATYFIDWLIPWAAQLPGGGVTIPLPKEYER